MSARLPRCFAAVVVTLASISWAAAPTVVSTQPVNGATGVATDLDQVVFTFSTPMGGGYSINGLSGSWSFQWSDGGQSFIATRNGGAAWNTGTILTIILNAPPYTSFTDTDGVPLATYTFSFTVGGSSDPDAPTVTSTSPVNGDAEAPVDLQTVTVTFSEPMSEQVNVSVNGPWYVSQTTPRTWSGDGRTFSLSRDHAADPLPSSSVVTMVLNPAGSGFQDADGHRLGTYSFSFTTESPGPEEPPVVVSSIPADGSRGVGVFTSDITIVFSKQMTSGSSISCSSGGWQTGIEGWSDNGHVYHRKRSDTDRLLPAGEQVVLTLNPDGAEGFRDTDGNPLATTRITFGVEPTSRLLKVRPEDSDHDFDWPYLLFVPDGVSRQTTLLVEPNNSGFVSDQEAMHEQSALSLLGWRAHFAIRLGVPLLVPVFPRPLSSWRIYTHALDRDSLMTTVEGIERIDLQLIEMIEDARERLARFVVFIEPKVYMMGFSASGQFTDRFAILHPDRIRAAAAGSPGGWPLAPVTGWHGETLNYNVGIADVESLMGTALDMAAVHAVPIFLFMGDADTNDSVPYEDGYDPDQREQVNRLFGTTPVARWPRAKEIYESAGMNAIFKLYPGVTHTITEEMFDDVAAFFADHQRPDTIRAQSDAHNLGRASGQQGATSTLTVVGPTSVLDSGGRPEGPVHEDPPPVPKSPN